MSFISDLLKSAVSGASSSKKKSSKKAAKKSSGDIIDAIGDQVKVRANAYKSKRLKGNILDTLISADVVDNVVDMAENQVRAQIGKKKGSGK